MKFNVISYKDQKTIDTAKKFNTFFQFVVNFV